MWLAVYGQPSAFSLPREFTRPKILAHGRWWTRPTKVASTAKKGINIPINWPEAVVQNTLTIAAILLNTKEPKIVFNWKRRKILPSALELRTPVNLRKMDDKLFHFRRRAGLAKYLSIVRIKKKLKLSLINESASHPRLVGGA